MLQLHDEFEMGTDFDRDSDTCTFSAILSHPRLLILTHAVINMTSKT